MDNGENPKKKRHHAKKRNQVKNKPNPKNKQNAFKLKTQTNKEENTC